jgi:hypothetical protein
VIVLDSLANLEAFVFFNQKLEVFLHHMKQYVLDVMYLFLSFLREVEKKNDHNIFALMLPKFKFMRLVSIYMGHDNATILVVAYDELVLLPLLMEVYKSSLPFVEEP